MESCFFLSKCGGLLIEYLILTIFNFFFLITEAERKAAWEEYENEKKGINTMVNTTNLNMGVVMNQINPEVIRVSTEYILYSFDFKQQNQDI